MLRKLTRLSWHFEWLEAEPGKIETFGYRNDRRAMAQMLLRDEESFSGMLINSRIGIASAAIENAKLLGMEICQSNIVVSCLLLPITQPPSSYQEVFPP
jgi:hypothetical protein